MSKSVKLATGKMDSWRIPVGGGAPEQLTFVKRNVAFPTPVDARMLLFVAIDESGAGPCCGPQIHGRPRQDGSGCSGTPRSRQAPMARAGNDGPWSYEDQRENSDIVLNDIPTPRGRGTAWRTRDRG